MEQSVEGVIKFQTEWLKSGQLIFGGLSELIKWRQVFFDAGLIGATPDGIGFGNISMRFQDSDNFVISGTQTGGIKQLDGRHFTKVIGVDLEQNLVKCVGPVNASSETMTHAAFYQASKSINAVLHIHKNAAWEKLIKLLPKTNEATQYGTPAMAKEIIALYGEKGAPSSGIFIMAGHKDGIIAFGENLMDAASIIIKYAAPELKRYLA